MEHSSRLKAALGACVLVTLAACGGSGSDSTQVAAAQGSSATGAGAGTGAAGNSGQIGSDSFLAQIVAMLGTSSDSADPVPVDSVSATSSDTAEPFSIM